MRFLRAVRATWNPCRSAWVIPASPAVSAAVTDAAPPGNARCCSAGMRTSKPVSARRKAEPNALRAATDELGITTPKTATRRRRKGPMRVKVYKDLNR